MARVAEHRGASMGTDAHVVAVDAPRGALDEAVRLLDGLERRWSRFASDSEVSRLNRAGGAPVAVSGETALLLGLARTSRRRTLGRFDPTMAAAIEACGYDEPLEVIRRRAAHTADTPIPVRRGVRHGPPAPGPRPGADDDAWLDLDPVAGTARLVGDVRFDPGGIGKGLAADLVLASLLGSGARGALVNVGGDLRVEGPAPDPTGWRIALPSALGGGTLSLSRGAVAVSAPTARTWRRDGCTMHHLLDPDTRQPARAAATVAVVAGAAWWAEALATAAAVSPPDLALTLLGRAHGAVLTGTPEDEPRRLGALARAPDRAAAGPPVRSDPGGRVRAGVTT